MRAQQQVSSTTTKPPGAPPFQASMSTMKRKIDEAEMARRTIFVGALTKDAWNEAVLNMAFLPFGPIDVIKLGRPGVAFVSFQSPADADEARENMDGAEISGAPVRCETAVHPSIRAHTNDDKPVWQA
jgi:RNA recognition motif-containing protein